MMHGFGQFGMAFGLIHLIVIAAFFYFLYSMSNSLKRIADRFDKNDGK
ncbi:MAG: hypothetical protein H6Q74_3192 [Firmicutes bacterium]|nr:hypothetical protein [Bacillota bacterium]